ncbi:hypothetical protein VTJ49DRAFT_539 [Mycothermus thermophilus]|uniref:Ribose-phosphate pyrophosphokinase N-terminal domain-containing protein n=1 Tax=Humicola insolens TaxID=85995 RepID=A0ABR3VF39_HUMIN
MVRNLVLLSGSSHPTFADKIGEALGVPPAARVLTHFSSGETRCEIRDSVRGKDVYIVQSFGVGGISDGKRKTVDDYFIELCIMISACKTGSAARVTAVLPLFPYSRQPDLPFSMVGAPHGSASASTLSAALPPTLKGDGGAGAQQTTAATMAMDEPSLERAGAQRPESVARYTTHDYENPALMMTLQQKARSGHKHLTAQAGPLVADLLTCAGADRVLTCDLHEAAYQGFFDIPVDNLYARPLLQRYIRHHIPNYRDAVIVSPDAGGAKRATAIADRLGLAIALIHKERRPPDISHPQRATMMLVGDVAGRLCILIDDLADTARTLTRAARLLRRAGAARVVALLTHGVLSGDAPARLAAALSSSGPGTGTPVSAVAGPVLDRVVVTNTVPQEEHAAVCGPRFEVLDVSGLFAEAIRRVHYGESLMRLFEYDE